MASCRRVAAYNPNWGPGVADDLPYGWIDKYLDFCDYFFTRVIEYEKLVERVKGLGIIGRDEIINWGLSGPMLRVSGIQCDLHKVDHSDLWVLWQIWLGN